MRAFLDEIQATLDCGIWSPALAAVLIVPDACGAIEFPALKNGERYTDWYDAHVEPFGFTAASSGELVWKIRNAMLHEAGMQFDAFGLDRVIFVTPNKSGITLDQGRSQSVPGGPMALMLDLIRFVQRILLGAGKWLSAIAIDQEKQSRLDRLLQFRPTGLSPHLIGLPVVA